MSVKFQSPAKIQFLEGVGTLYYDMDPFDPYVCLRVGCQKHPQHRMPVYADFFESNMTAAILSAVKNCPGCKEVQQWEATKFPEGAEL